MMTTLLSPAAARWLDEHHHVATTADLRRLGIDRAAINRLINVGMIERHARGVFTVTTGSPSLEHRCRVLCCLYPHGFVTGPTAAMLGGLRRQPYAAGLHYSLAHGMHPTASPGVVFRQTTKLASRDHYERPDGIVVASWQRLAFDLAADLSAIDHRSVIHQLRDRELVTNDQLLANERRLCHPARRGSTTYRMSMLELGGGVADSHPEVLLGDALVRRGVPVEAQLEVDIGGGIVRHLDLGVGAIKWGVELDIHPEHRSLDGHHRDTRRVRSLHRGGWQIEPVAERDVASPAELERTADELAALYRDRWQEVQPSMDVPENVRSILG